MFFHGMIKFLNLIFISALGFVTLQLFFQSLILSKVRRSSPKKRAELLLEVRRDGAPFLSSFLTKSHYIIGRGPECDIPLRGMGIPLRVAEICPQEGGYVVKSFQDNSLSINSEPFGSEEKRISPEDEIKFCNYSFKIKRLCS